ncbi:MAG: hypothetical protein K6C99_07575 [Lachnospiraceae bacterium]|nr:hypothetical protein [Lachnospiraceae bacterium]
MAMMEKPVVQILNDGTKYWEHTYESFFLKVVVPVSKVEGDINNYGFRAPLLLVFEEERLDRDGAVAFAAKTGLADIAADVDSSVLFVYPTCEGGWKNATTQLYIDLIAEIKMDSNYTDGYVSITDFFTREFKGYFVRGAKFRTDIYSKGASADYVAKNLLKTIEGEYLWGPGEITPAMCSMEKLSVVPDVERKDIAVITVGNSAEINAAFDGCESLLIKDEADYKEDFKSFVRKFKMWCGHIDIEPDFKSLDMTEKAGKCTVHTSPYNMGKYKGTKEHPVGYFAYYNNDLFDKGPAPLLVGFHGGGDSSMYLTFVVDWWEIAHRYGFMFVSVENHQDVTAAEAMELIDHIRMNYNIDEKRIYATGFSMGSGKTWDLFMEFPGKFAGMAPGSALFPVKNNIFGRPWEDGAWVNRTVPVPIFYSGGEKTFLPELPNRDITALERVQYAAEANNLKKKFDVDFEDKDNWPDPLWGETPDRREVIHDEVRDANLTVNYYDSEDGVCRTAFASIDNQIHEYRHHTAEEAWKFISKFTR